MTVKYDSLDDARMQISLLLKGPPGGGKTYKAAQFPAPVIFNFDNNLAGLRKLPPETRKGIRIVNPRVDEKGNPVKGIAVWDNFIRRLNLVLADPTVKTVVFDSLTTLTNVLMDKILGSDLPSVKVLIQHYGDYARYIKWLGDDVLCASDCDKCFIWLAHEMEDKQGNLTLNLPTASVRDSMDAYFSDCWRAYTKAPMTGPVEYRVRVLPGTNFTAKCTLEVPTDFLWDKEAKTIMKQIEDRCKTQ